VISLAAIVVPIGAAGSDVSYLHGLAFDGGKQVSDK
jgi:hypothetical protein